MKTTVAFTLALTVVFTAIVGNHAEAAKSKPDLIVSAVRAPSSASTNATIVVSSTVKNQGRASSNAFGVGFYLAVSPSSVTGATLLGTQNVTSLTAGASVTLVGSLVIPGRTANGTFYVVAVADSAKFISESNESNNSRPSDAMAVTDSTPPIISSVSSSGITASSATIAWITDESSTSQVEFGTTTAYGSMSSPDTTKATGHSVTLSGLIASTAYHFRVRSADAAGNLALSSDFTLTTPAPTVGLDYFVAPNGSNTADGSAASPWATIQHAANSVGPGATVHVAPGDYAEAIVSNISGTDTARIQFVSDTPWGAKIRTTGTEIVWENRGNYLDIEGFDISSDDARIGIANFSDLGYVRIVGNHVHNFPGTGCTSQGGAGILQDYYYGEADSDTIGNVVDHIGPSGCNLVHGIYHSTKGGKIHNNIVHNAAGWGIHTWHAATEVTIANNLVFENGSGGIIVGAGDSPGGVMADGFTVSNNIVIYNGYGIMEYGQTGVNNRYLNNLVYGNLYNGFQLQNGNVDLGTVIANPQFVNYQPDGGGDHRLTPQSPAIDFGTSVGAPPDDFDGIARPQGAGWDIGPYEWRP